MSDLHPNPERRFDICKNCDQPIYQRIYRNGEKGVWTHTVTERYTCEKRPPHAEPSGPWREEA